ncbi:MAG: PD40 domain-containing protein [Sedimentisphaerales bacterium]|nr:PD40 domain-containing protein [Sedimentisphaerales bacterium]
MFQRKDLRHCCFPMFVLVLVTVGAADAKPKLKFGIPSNLGSLVNSHSNDGAFSLSPDGLELYFGSDRGGGYGGWDIWLTTRLTREDPWEFSVNPGSSINTLSGEGAPYLSADGLALYFASNRPGGHGNYDIWVSTRATLGSPWGEAVNLGPSVNTWADECCQVISPNGLELYFAELAVFHPSGYGGGDIWLSKRESVSDSWGDATNLGLTVNSPDFESVATISPDGLTLYFDSDRPGGYGSTDVWVTTRASLTDPWEQPVNLGPPINSLGYDAFCMFLPDGSKAYFTSSIAGFGWNDIWQVPVSVVSTCDLDDNGVVDLRDFAAFAEDWLWEEVLD